MMLLPVVFRNVGLLMVKQAGVPALSQLTYGKFPIEVPLIQISDSSSFAAQILIAFGVHAAWASRGNKRTVAAKTTPKPTIRFQAFQLRRAFVSFNFTRLHSIVKKTIRDCSRFLWGPFSAL
jgi:hypothetical protein